MLSTIFVETNRWAVEVNITLPDLVFLGNCSWDKFYLVRLGKPWATVLLCFFFLIPPCSETELMIWSIMGFGQVY